MTVTYTFPAQRIRVDRDEIADTSEILEVGPSSISFTYPRGTTTVSYVIEDFEPGDLAPEILVIPLPLAVDAGGRDVFSLLDRFDVETFIGRFQQPEGATTFLVYQLDPIDDSLVQEEFFINLDGPPLPTLSSPSEVEAFALQLEQGIVSIPASDPFAPGQDIAFSSLPGVTASSISPPPPPAENVPTPGPDVLAGGPGPDTIDGGSGDDTITGGGGDDLLVGGPGADVLDGGPGADTLRGDDGNDRFLVDDPRDVVRDSGGVGDVIETTVSYSLRGATGIELLVASGAAPVRLDGTPGDEELVGNAGDNILIGLGGQDTVRGNGGADSFVLFGRVTPTDLLIADFDRAEGDRLAIDDQLLGLGELGVDIRAVTGAEVRALLEAGTVAYDRAAQVLSIDADGDGAADNFATFIGTPLTAGDVVLF
jgi:hypothetical protein